MTVGRIFGDRLTVRFGAVTLVRACGVLAALGLGGALLVGHGWAGVLGFACLGAGMSCIAPQVYSAAGARNPTRAGGALARVVSMGYAGFLVGPLLIGGAATLVGLPAALAIPALLALFVALSAPALRPSRSAGAAGSPGVSGLPSAAGSSSTPDARGSLRPPGAAGSHGVPGARGAVEDDQDRVAESEVPLHFRAPDPDLDRPPAGRQ
jgi:MFS family permease